MLLWKNHTEGIIFALGGIKLFILSGIANAFVLCACQMRASVAHNGGGVAILHFEPFRNITTEAYITTEA